MNKRGGPPVKLIVIAATLLGCVYLLYLYNSSQGRLREAEASAERYRRSDESKVAQLQDSMKEKELLQEKCENDRQEFVNRLNSLNSQHKMLKGQHDELEAENGRLQQEMQKARDDNANVESQHRQEFSQMKQEKELDIASLRDQIANMQRQNDNLQNEISSLKAQLENSQQNAAAAANALNQVQGNQQQQQNFVQQQNGEQQQQIFAQQQAQAAQQAAQQAVQQAGQINQAGGLQANDLVYQAQGQGQFQGQGQAQGQEAVQNMNQKVNQDINNPNMNAGAQVPNAGQDANNQHQMAAVDLQQGQGQGQGQQGVNNDQHQMQAPNMDAANQEAGNQNQNKTAVVQHHPAQGGLTEKPLDDLKPVKDKAVEAKNNTTLAPKSKLGSHFGDDAAIKTQKKESFRDKLLGLKQKADGDDIGKEGHPDDVKVIDAFDNLKVDPGKPQEVKQKALGNNTDHIVPGHDEQAPKSPENEGNVSQKQAVGAAMNASKSPEKEGNESQKQAVGVAMNAPKSPENEENESQKQAVEEQPKVDLHEDAQHQPAQGQEQVAGVVMQAQAPKAPQNEGEVQKQNAGDVDVDKIHPPVLLDDHVADDKEIQEQRLQLVENKGGEVKVEIERPVNVDVPVGKDSLEVVDNQAVPDA